MKQFFTLALAGLLALSMHAQGSVADKATPRKMVRHHQTATPSMANRAIIDYNDVSDCTDWEFGNGADDTGYLWEDIDLDFVCSTEGPAGPFNQWVGGTGNGQAADPINSTTADNGFLLIDSDLFGIEAQYDASWVENSWVQIAEPVNCGGNEFVAITFESRYRCWDNGASDGSEKCFVEISRDGVSWPTLSSDYVTSWEEDGLVIYGEDTVQCRYEVFPDSETGYETDDPSLLEFDISEAAGNQGEVWYRFRWVGTWGYSWEIDDIYLVDIEENDTRIDGYFSYTNYFQTGIYENGAWAQSQMLPTLSAGAKAYNFGYGTQDDVTLDVEVNGVLYNSDTISSFPNASADTLVAEYPAMDVGTYTVNYLLTAADVDDNPDNNTATQSFEVTEYSYGRDNGELFDIYGGAFDFVSMPYYDIHNDVTIYGIDVAIMDGAISGSPIRAFIVDMNEVIPLDGSLAGFESAQSGERTLNPDYTWSGTGDVVWYTFEFENPYQASAGDWIGAAFEYYGGDALTIGESSTTFDGTAAIYGPAGADDTYAWRGTDEMPMVRLNLDPNLEDTPNSVIELEDKVIHFESMPNPATTEATIRFELLQAKETTLEVRDLQGKVLVSKDFGILAAGEYNHNVDVSAWAAGTYSYTLVIDGERATRKLVVQ